MKRLRHDILERFGTDAFPTHDTINQIPYRKSLHDITDQRNSRLVFHFTVRAVINETLRLFPPVSNQP